MNTAMSGNTWYGDQMMGSATMGAFSGAAGGVTGAYFGSGEYNINLFGNAGASYLSGGVSGGVGEMMAGGSFRRGFRDGGLTSLAGTYLGYGISRIRGPAPGTYDGTDLTISGAQKGDVVAFGSDGSLLSEFISIVSAGDYSHIGVVDKDENGLFVREATGDGSNIQTKLSDYSSRPYKIISRGNSVMAGGYDYTGLAIINTLSGSQSPGYALSYRNCTSQAAGWTGHGFMNNPNAMSNHMLNFTPCFNRYNY